MAIRQATGTRIKPSFRYTARARTREGRIFALYLLDLLDPFNVALHGFDPHPGQVYQHSPPTCS